MADDEQHNVTSSSQVNMADTEVNITVGEASAHDESRDRSALSVVVAKYGGYDALRVESLPLEALGPAQVEVAVAACGMNFSDLYLRQGLMGNLKPPFILGAECAGTVTAVGTQVTSLQVGDRVLCYQYTGGMYRETVVIDEQNVYTLPDSVSFEHGAALACNYLTAYFSLLDIGYLRPHQSVLIHSCAGGVGCAATQLARTVEGVTVYGTASSTKHDAARANGVDHPLAHENYEHELLKLSPEGVDVIIDNMAGPNFTVSQRLLRPLGRAILTGANNMISTTQKLSKWSLFKVWWTTRNVSPTELITMNRVVAGLHLGTLIEKDPKRVRTALDHLFRLYQEGKVAPIINSVWSFDKVVDATKVLAERRNVGKVLLKPRMSAPGTQ